MPSLSHDDVHGMVYDIMNDGQRKHYEENLERDSFEIPNPGASASTPSTTNGCGRRDADHPIEKFFRSKT